MPGMTIVRHSARAVWQSTFGAMFFGYWALCGLLVQIRCATVTPPLHIEIIIVHAARHRSAPSRLQCRRRTPLP